MHYRWTHASPGYQNCIQVSPRPAKMDLHVPRFQGRFPRNHQGNWKCNSGPTHTSSLEAFELRWSYCLGLIVIQCSTVRMSESILSSPMKKISPLLMIIHYWIMETKGCFLEVSQLNGFSTDCCPLRSYMIMSSRPFWGQECFLPTWAIPMLHYWWQWVRWGSSGCNYQMPQFDTISILNHVQCWKIVYIWFISIQTPYSLGGSLTIPQDGDAQGKHRDFEAEANWHRSHLAWRLQCLI